MTSATYASERAALRWLPLPVKGGASGLILVLIGTLILLGKAIVQASASTAFAGKIPVEVPVAVGGPGKVLIAVGLALVGFSIMFWRFAPKSWRLLWQLRRRLFDPKYGNPLGFKRGQRLPNVRVRAGGEGLWATIACTSNSADEIRSASPQLSAATSGSLASFAIAKVDVDPASRFVSFLFSDMDSDRTIQVNHLSDLLSGSVTELRVQKGLSIDLTRSGSMLVAGVTRSGKTTGIIALLLQLLAYGPDEHGSRILIIDPKKAELSRLPHSLAPDLDGSPENILEALREIDALRGRRQAYLSELSSQSGSAIKWWDAQMHPTVVFIDEFVALRTLFPAKTAKNDGKCNIVEFTSTLQRLTTMGASAGVFLIVSVAQASVENVSSMLRRAFSTRVLFRPTIDDARLLWDGDTFKNLPERIYEAGDCWFSSEDGHNDHVTFAHFPRFSQGFGEYKQLAQLLERYYRG